MTKEEIRRESYEKVLKKCKENNYIVLTPFEDFVNNETQITYLCPSHGEQTTKATNLKQGKRCKLCANIMRGIHTKETRFNKEKLQIKYWEKANDICESNGYKLISRPEDFGGYHDYIQYECLVHGIKKITFGNLCSKKFCKQCAIEEVRKKYVLTINEVIARVEQCNGVLVNPEDYLNNSEKNLKIICPRCKKNIINTSLKHFIQHGGQFCEQCARKESMGEYKIRTWLENKGIDYIQEKWFPDCRDINPLPFDFYLPEKNMVIEFDGEQHNKESHFFDHNRSDISSYIKKHDEIKNKYCVTNKIELLRIPYKSLNQIDDLLTKKLIA